MEMAHSEMKSETNQTDHDQFRISVNSNRQSVDNSQEMIYNFVRSLGRGAFGEAVLYRKVEDNSLVVWKEIDLSKMKEKQRIEAQNEIEILSRLNHPSIVSYYNHFMDGNTLLIEMEYADGGSLHHKISSRLKPFKEEEVLWYFYQIASAIGYIHKCYILHRDIKSLNLFLTKTGLIKCGDFGISKKMENTKDLANSIVGTTYYMSPEVIKGEPYGYKSDIWSMGCVLYEMLTLRKVFDATNQLRLVKNIVRGEFEKIDSSYSSDLNQLTYSMLEQDIEKRPTAQEVLKHSLFNSLADQMDKKINELNSSRCRIREAGIVPVVTSTTSDVFIWGGGKLNPQKLDLFNKRTAVQVACGTNHFAVVTVDKELYTWCSAQKTSNCGELGHNNTANYKTPKKVCTFEGKHVRQAVCGDQFSVALTDDGQAFSTGSNYYGCLGIDESIDEAYEFTLITKLSAYHVSQISCGHNYTVAITNDCNVFSWGCGEMGRLGLGDEDDRCVPNLVDIKGEFRSVICGIDNTFLITQTGRLLACGSNQHNKSGFNCSTSGLKNNPSITYDPPCKLTFTTVKPLTNYDIVNAACGKKHSACVDVYGRLITFGSNKYGQLGVGDFKRRKIACKVHGPLSGKRVTKVTCGDKFTVIATAENQVFCCGSGENGRLGWSTDKGGAGGRGPNNECYAIPRPVFGSLHAVSDMSSNNWHTILVAEKVLAQKTIHSTSNSLKQIYDSQISYESSQMSEIRTDTENEKTEEDSTGIKTWLLEEWENVEYIPVERENEDKIEKVEFEHDDNLIIAKLREENRQLMEEKRQLQDEIEQCKKIVQQQAEIIRELNSKRVQIEDRLEEIWKAFDQWQSECCLTIDAQRKATDAKEVFTSSEPCAIFEEDL